MMLLLVVAVTALGYSQVAEAIYCPFMDCTFPELCLGQTLHTSFLPLGDSICPVCPTCVAPNILQGGVGKRFIFFGCPRLVCPPVDCVTGSPTVHKFTVMGHECLGCPVCSDVTQTQRSALPPGVLPYMGCPIVECALVGRCPGGYHFHSYVTLDGGQKCTGCPYCLPDGPLPLAPINSQLG